MQNEVPRECKAEVYQRKPGEVLESDFTAQEMTLINEYDAIKKRLDAMLEARGQADEERIKYHRRQLWFLKDSLEVARCEKIHADGRRCGSPKMNSGRLCYAHQRAEDAKPKKLALELMVDANAVILNLALVQKAMLDGQITPKEAGQLFYSIHTAAIVINRVTVKATKPEEIVTELPEEELAALGQLSSEERVGSGGSASQAEHAVSPAESVVDGEQAAAGAIQSGPRQTNHAGDTRDCHQESNSTDESNKSFGLLDGKGVGDTGTARAGEIVPTALKPSAAEKGKANGHKAG